MTKACRLFLRRLFDFFLVFFFILIGTAAEAREPEVSRGLLSRFIPEAWSKNWFGEGGLQGSVLILVGFCFALLVLVWKLRLFIQKGVLKVARVFGVEGTVWALTDFVLDRPFERPWFIRLGQMFQKLLIGVPAILLIYAASCRSILMPSFLIEPQQNLFFWQLVQVLLAVLILMELALPLVGAAFAALLAYFVWHYGVVVASDALPILAIAYAYLQMPMLLPADRQVLLRQEQITAMRIILGLGFCVMGVLRAVSHEILLQAEVLQVFLGLVLALGLFSRLTSLLAALMLARLLVGPVGWQSMPYLYFIAVLLLVCFSKVYDPVLYQLYKRRQSDQVAAGVVVQVEKKLA